MSEPKIHVRMPEHARRQPASWASKRSGTRIRSALLLCAALLALIYAGDARPARAEHPDVLVFAAASLKTALDEINAQWHERTGKRVTISYAASSALAKQIEQGAPADLFISADEDWMDYLAERKLIRPETRSDLVGNRLVLISSKGADLQVNIVPGFPLLSLLGQGRLAMANTEAVPAGKYGRAALEALGVWESVKGRIAQAENVRAALLLVSRGEAPLGIVYESVDETGSVCLRQYAQNAGGARYFREARFHDTELRPAVFTLTPEEQTAVELSVRVSLWATVTSLPPGLAMAMLLSRGKFWGKSILNGIVFLPLVLPPVVTGYILLLLFGRRGPLGAFLADNFGIVFAFRWTGAALACAVMGFPLLVRAMQLSIDSIDRALEDAAGTLGANPVWVFVTVTLPLILPGIIAGTILSFARAMGEFGATITFVSNIPGETQTLPSAIYTFTQVPGGDVAAFRLTVIAIVVSMSALLISEAISYVVGQRIGVEG